MMYFIEISGVVQGVGFRPFIYKLARSLGLKGYVKNTLRGVEILVDRNPELFVQQIKKKKPPVAEIYSIRVEERLDAPHYEKFEILSSDRRGKKNILLTPDIALCDKCIKELEDTKDRRYRYAFINCTDCGPRFTIIQDLPYDRKHTSMREFEMCPACEAEYKDIETRRFHAQPNCCELCGPHYFLVDAERNQIASGDDAIRTAINLIREGKIIALKGLGGFHLICDAYNDNVIQTLRRRKNRPHKPLALMIKDLNTVRTFCNVSPEEARLLNSPQKPIVLLKKKSSSTRAVEFLSHFIAPDNNYLGVMLPYTPAHYLILKELDVIVATSGNREGEPIEIDNTAALKNLNGIADFFLLHNRDIVNRVDDSIVFFCKGIGTVMIRRARGYVPLPVKLKNCGNIQVLGVGAEENSTFCISKGDFMFLSQYIGDLKNYKCVDFFEENLQRFFFYFDFTSEVVVSDLHPEYSSTQIARKMDTEVTRIQHHYAHFLAAVVSNQLDVMKPRLGVIWDGTGLGYDGKIWGSEFILGNARSFKRLACIRDIPLFGGDKAINEPWLIGLALLMDAGLMSFARELWAGKRLEFYSKFLDRDVNVVKSSGMGRLFDGVAAILGLLEEITFDAEAAILLQMQAEKSKARSSYSFLINTDREPFEIDWRPIIYELLQDLRRGKQKSIIARKFHNTLIKIILKLARHIKSRYNFEEIVLSGGCWQNQLLLSQAVKELTPGFALILPKDVPPNDESISLGQVTYVLSNTNANCRDKRRMGKSPSRKY